MGGERERERVLRETERVLTYELVWPALFSGKRKWESWRALKIHVRSGDSLPRALGSG